MFDGWKPLLDKGSFQNFEVDAVDDADVLRRTVDGLETVSDAVLIEQSDQPFRVLCQGRVFGAI